MTDHRRSWLIEFPNVFWKSWSGREDLNLPCGPWLSSPQPRDSLRLSSCQALNRASSPGNTTCTTRPTEQTLTRHELAVLLRRRGPSVPRATFHPWGASRPHPMLRTPKGSARTWSRATPSAKRFVVEPGSNSGRPHQLAAIGVIEPTAIFAPLSISRRNSFQRRSLGHDSGVDVAPEGDQ